MADARRRLRDVSESSEYEESANDTSLCVTECESEAGMLSQNVTGVSESEDQNDTDEESATDNEPDEKDESRETNEDERRRLHRSSEGASNDGSNEGKEEDNDSGQSQVLQGSDASDDEVVDVVTEDEDAEDAEEDGTKDEVWMSEKRHSGDGEEQVSSQTAEKKLDADEDKENPAYIPRKGYFYEHDMRNEAEDETADKTEQPKRKLWSDDKKWLHDRYDERAQMPKTREELISDYGYDIRAASRPDGNSMTRRRGRARGGRGPRGIRQLKDFMGDRDDRANQRSSAADQLSDGYEAVASDHSDGENAGRWQPVNRAGGRRGRGRPAGSSRGRYSDMQQQYGDAGSSRGRYSEMRRQYGDHDQAEGPRYSSVRGHSPRDDSGGQRRGYGSGINERRRADDDRYHPERNRGRGKQAIVDRENYDDRQRVYAERGQQQEDWQEEMVSGHYSKDVEQRKEHVQAVSLRTLDNRTSAQRPVHGDGRVSDGNVHSQQQEDKYTPREPPRRVHPTRTISNSQFHAADNIPNKDRGSQIGGIVDAMNRISVRMATDERRDVSSTQQNVTARSAMIVSGTTVPEIIPPLTQTQGRTVPPMAVTSAKLHEQVVKSGDFVPRMTITQSSAAVAQQMSKPKRYSTQRQRAAADADAAGDVPYDIPNTAVPAADTAYYADNENLPAKPVQYLPPSPMVPLSSIAYRLPAMPPETYYETAHGPQQTAASPPSLVHAARYLGPPSQMMPPPAGSYYVSQPPPPPAYGFPSASLIPARPPFCLPAPQLRQYIPPSPTPQMITEPSPSMEVRSGTVYFNAETQQPELRVGGIYYGPAGQPQSTSAALPVRRPNSAIPIVNPQEAEHAMPASIYYNEYIYTPASNQMSYDGVAAGAVENVQTQNSVA